MKKCISLVVILVLILNYSIFFTFQAFAHEASLGVIYDNCYDCAGAIDEKWYVIVYPGIKCYHISHEVQTIKYYFADNPESGYGWDDVPDGAGEDIKSSYVESMKKWNNVYFYSYDSAGNVVKNKVINIVEGTLTDHNLIIYPTNDVNDSIAHAEIVSGSEETIERTNTIDHYHSLEWFMTINVDYFYVHGNRSAADVNILRDRTGAHEIGHILGLRDIDEAPCGSYVQESHHEDLLMGYGGFSVLPSTDITYKDIAGVAITRGFHTDSDHKWLYAGLDYYGKHKLICSICNGVNAVDSLSGYTYDTYNACGGNHTLSSGNMMAVASYGTSDYYKCKYCRYVAPFENIIAQDYDKTYYTDALHKCENDVDGLEYTYYEEHSPEYSNISSTHHADVCECGYQMGELQPHNLNFGGFSENGHTLVCECGYTSEEDHLLTYQQSSDISHALICECGYTREETHSLAYQRASDEYHRLVCDCGYSYNEDHTLTYQDYHTDICVCGYTYTTPHNFTYQEGSDVNHHIATCECGYDDEVWHTWTYKSTSTSHHSCICPCGYVKIGEAHVFEQVGLRYSVCKFCGYTRDNTGPGGNVIMGEKTEEEKE